MKNYVDFNFHVAPEFRHMFRNLAAIHNRSGVSIVREALIEWQQRHGGPELVTEAKND